MNWVGGEATCLRTNTAPGGEAQPPLPALDAVGQGKKHSVRGAQNVYTQSPAQLHHAGSHLSHAPSLPQPLALSHHIAPQAQDS